MDGVTYPPIHYTRKSSRGQYKKNLPCSYYPPARNQFSGAARGVYLAYRDGKQGYYSYSQGLINGRGKITGNIQWKYSQGGDYSNGTTHREGTIQMGLLQWEVFSMNSIGIINEWDTTKETHRVLREYT